VSESVRSGFGAALEPKALDAPVVLTEHQDESLYHEGFDPGSEWTLAAWIRHASRTRTIAFGWSSRVA